MAIAIAGRLVPRLFFGDVLKSNFNSSIFSSLLRVITITSIKSGTGGIRCLDVHHAKQDTGDVGQAGNENSVLAVHGDSLGLYG